MSDSFHVPVLTEETLRALAPKPGGTYADGTVGHGGHARLILEASGPDGRLLCIDRDPRNLSVARERLAPYGSRVLFVQGSYGDLPRFAAEHGITAFDGILLDIGFSSAHVDDPARGFSFAADGPLDMRYDPAQDTSAATIVNGWKKEELATLFRLYGEEPAADRIAEAIFNARKLERIVRTTQLATLVEAVVPRRGRIHPATKIFQALRIAVNDELGELERILPAAADLLAPGGRLAVISFHSLEDRIVKQFLASRFDLEALTKRPVVASEEEATRNPRARSAKLRAATKR